MGGGGRAWVGWGSTALVWLWGCALAGAQVLELSGGRSTMYESQGGSVSVQGRRFEAGASAGMVGDELIAGGHLSYRSEFERYSAGMTELTLNLPTDTVAGGHRLIGVGGDVVSSRGGSRVELFGGATSTRVDGPLVQGVTPVRPAGALLVRLDVTPKVSLTSDVLYASTWTVLEGVSWRVNPSLLLAASSGFGSGARYNAVAMTLKRRRLEVKASYVDAGSGFHRTGSQPDVASEPVRENVTVAWRSGGAGRVALSGSRQNLLVGSDAGTALPVSAGSSISSTDEVSASAEVMHTSVSGSAIHSQFGGRENVAFVASAERPVTQRLQLGMSYYESQLLNAVAIPASQLLVAHAQEIVSNRWTLNQSLQFSDGRATAGFGGSLISNLATISADYQTYYLATRLVNPFQQSLSLDVRINLFGRVTLHGGTSVSPDGRLVYTMEMRAIASRTGTPVARTERIGLGLSMISGRVVDMAGDAVEGAAIEIGGRVLYTNSEGAFFYRESHPADHVVNVLLEQFLDGRRYRVVSQPTVMASRETWQQAGLIVVDQVALPVIRIEPPGRHLLPKEFEIYGPYVPYRPGGKAPRGLKPGETIPGRFLGTLQSKPGEEVIYGEFVPYEPPAASRR